LSYGKSDKPTKPTRLDRVKAKFNVCEDGLLRNERLENERLKRQAFIANMAENGKLGGGVQRNLKISRWF